MLRLLYRYFPEQFHKLVFHNQTKPSNFDKLEVAFVDSQGRRYFKFMSDFDMPIDRFGGIELKIKELSMGISSNELTQIVDAMEQALSKRDRHGLSPDIGMIGHLVQEIKGRKENLIHPDIMLDMVSYLYIREDENPYTLDEDIHSQKVKQFKIDSAGGLRDFFLNAGLSTYLPFLKESNGDLDQIMILSRARAIALQGQLKAYSSEKK